MTPGRQPLRVHCISPWIAVVIFAVFLFLSLHNAVMAKRPAYSRFEIIIAWLIVVVVWGAFFALLWFLRQQRVELYSEGLVHHQRQGAVRLTWQQVVRYEVHLTHNPHAGGSLSQAIWSRLAKNGERARSLASTSS
ncbi:MULTISPECIES: DUF6585 family protein [unclassified Corallococcus]|uniref:DUF6585 family protein n=1 Tax=unclassified Corallococcus TaxID=2685029 RepID=UPI001A8D72F8|nr:MULTISPECIES: DUF6585 family protein [unclassified Corallococcus]MBN9683440.1 hypothetical protein [Corallococcus sp. NCSPR001]WAS85041.1 hypothetical protein O0N60_38025 [Corallococcus sp. NCRR]